MLILILILQESSNDKWTKIFTDYWGLWVIIAGGILGALYLFSGAHKQIHETETKNVSSLKALVDTRDKELADKDKQLETKESELKHLNDVIDQLKSQLDKRDESLDALQAEYESLAGLILHELLDFKAMRLLIESQKLVITEQAQEITTLMAQTLRQEVDKK